MIIALIIMSLIALGAVYLYLSERREHRKSLDLALRVQKEAYEDWNKVADELEEARTHILAIEQGRDEETECYEAQYLSFEDITKSLTQQINGLKSDNGALRIQHELHQMFCLPDLRRQDYIIADMETLIEQMDDTPVFNSVMSYMT